MSEQRSWAAVGVTMFAALMLMLVGVFHAIAGLAGIFENEFYAVTPNYVFEFDVTVWGWIHLIWGVIVIVAGFSVLGGAVWARTIGVVLASLSALANFAFIPYHPLWSFVIIALDVAVIWALTVHGRDIAME